MKNRLSKEKRIDVVVGTLSILGFLLIWELLTKFTQAGDLIPGPITVLVSFISSFFHKIGKHLMSYHIWISLYRVMIGYLIGAVVGIVLGILMGWYKKWDAFFMPLFRIIRPIPPIAWIPISIVWFGLGESAKIFLIFLSSFSNVTLNSYMGASNVDPEIIGAARMLGAKPKDIFLTIVLPASIPNIFAGLQVALSACWATVVAAEMVRSSEGLGWMIVAGMNMNDMVQILTGIVAIGVVGFILAFIMRKLEKRLCRWSKSGK